MIHETLLTVQETMPNLLAVASLAAPAIGAILVKIGYPYKCEFFNNFQHGRQFPEGTDTGNAKVIKKQGDGQDKVEYILIPSGAGTMLTLSELKHGWSTMIQAIAHRVSERNSAPNDFQVGGAFQITERRKTFKKSVFRDRSPFEILPGVIGVHILDNNERRLLHIPTDSNLNEASVLKIFDETN